MSEQANASVVVEEIRMTQITVHRAMSWAKIRWQEDCGFVTIHSDYGSWSFGWPCHGRPSLAYFLASLDAWYMGGKMLGPGLDVFDEAASIAAVRAHVLECRREAGFCWTKERAREEWKLAGSIEEVGGIDEWYRETSIDDAWEIAHVTRMNPAWRQFWDRIWEPHVRPELRRLAEQVA